MIRAGYKLIFVFLIFTAVLSGCDFYYRNMPFASIPAQTISGSVVIGSDWTEITPPEPLKPLALSNWIILGFYKQSKEKFIDTTDSKASLVLEDGRRTKIEAFLFDDKGESYEMEVSGISNGIMLSKKGEIKWSGEPNFSQPDYSDTQFPSNKKFTKLKIRSEIPLECDKIEWIGSNPK